MPLKVKVDGFWKSADNTITEARRFMEAEGLDVLPNSKRLVALGHVSLVYAIEAHHGGMRAFRELLGEDANREEYGKLRDEKYVREVVAGIILEGGFDHFPTPREFKEHGAYNILAGINRYHGGIYAFAQKMGIAPTNKKRGNWKDEDFVICEALDCMRREGYDNLPSGKVLHRDGYSGLWAGILRYHGGMEKFRSRLMTLGHVKDIKREKLETMLDSYLDEE